MRSIFQWLENFFDGWARARAATALSRQGRHDEARRLMTGE